MRLTGDPQRMSNDRPDTRRHVSQTSDHLQYVRDRDNFLNVLDDLGFYVF